MAANAVTGAVSGGSITAPPLSQKPPPQLITAISWAAQIGDVECRFTLKTPGTPNIDSEDRDTLLKAEKAFFEAVAKAMPAGATVDIALARAGEGR